MLKVSPLCVVCQQHWMSRRSFSVYLSPFFFATAHSLPHACIICDFRAIQNSHKQFTIYSRTQQHKRNDLGFIFQCKKNSIVGN